MAQFEKLQELWQGQAGPAVSPADIAALTHSLRAYGRRQNWINSGKVVAGVGIARLGVRAVRTRPESDRRASCWWPWRPPPC